MMHAEITGWGKALPPTVLSNADLERIVETSDDWITTRTGIKERRITHVELSELAAVAAEHALAAAGLAAPEVDLLITATCTPESQVPPTSALIQHRIGATRTGAFDLNANCSGFVYGLVVASDMIRSGSVRRVLLVGAEKLSYIMNYTDRNTCVLFGDGAGAVVVEASDERVGVLASDLGVDGSAAPNLCAPGYGSAGNSGDVTERRSGLKMDGQEVFRRAVTKMGESSAKVVDEAGWTLADVDILIPHQANQRIIDATARRLRLDDSKVFVNIHAYGNTSAATIPVALTEALEADRVAPGANVVFAAFGGGLTWGAAAVKWGQRVDPIGISDARLPATDQTVWDLIQPNIDFFAAKAARP
jgi:3-oxoacyl-[acyl-carrier-protein] synthase III